MRKTAIEQFGEWARRGIDIINALYHDPKCFTEFQSEIERKYSRGAMVLMQERVTEELFRQSQMYAFDDSTWGTYFSRSGIDKVDILELGYDDFDQKVITPLPKKCKITYLTYAHFISLVREVATLASPDISGWYAALEEYLLKQEPVHPPDVDIFNYYKFNINRLQSSLKDVTDLAAKIAYYELMKVEFGRMEKLSEQGLQYRKENYDPDFVAKCDIEIQMFRETRPSHRRLVWLGKPIELGCLINQLCECGYIETEKFNNASGFNKAAMSRLLEECFELRNGEFSSVEKMFDRTSTKNEFSRCLSDLPPCKK